MTEPEPRHVKLEIGMGEIFEMEGEKNDRDGGFEALHAHIVRKDIRNRGCAPETRDIS